MNGSEASSPPQHLGAVSEGNMQVYTSRVIPPC